MTRILFLVLLVISSVEMYGMKRDGGGAAGDSGAVFASMVDKALVANDVDALRHTLASWGEQKILIESPKLMQLLDLAVSSGGQSSAALITAWEAARGDTADLEVVNIDSYIKGKKFVKALGIIEAAQEDNERFLTKHSKMKQRKEWMDILLGERRELNEWILTRGYVDRTGTFLSRILGLVSLVGFWEVSQRLLIQDSVKTPLLIALGGLSGSALTRLVNPYPRKNDLLKNVNRLINAVSTADRLVQAEPTPGPVKPSAARRIHFSEQSSPYRTGGAASEASPSAPAPSGRGAGAAAGAGTPSAPPSYPGRGATPRDGAKK